MAEDQYVVFSLNDEEFGINIDKVREIVQPRKIVKLPQSLDFIEGIINLRGEIIPIVDLKKRYYGTKTETNETTRIIIVDLGDWDIGIIVDNVSEVQTLDQSQITVLPSFVLQFSARSGLRGVGKINNRLVILLDLSLAFSGEEKEMLLEATN